MAERIARAKQHIRASGVLFQRPNRDEQTARLRMVLHVLYLIFNEGYLSSSGRELDRTELSDEAIRLTGIVQRRLPEALVPEELLEGLSLINQRLDG
jgi:predicted RNA polymerase sigma factor